MILVLGLVLFVKQFRQFRHLLSLHLSVFVFVPKQKKNPTKKKPTSWWLSLQVMLHDFGLFSIFNYCIVCLLSEQLKCFVCTMLAKYALNS